MIKHDHSNSTYEEKSVKCPLCKDAIQNMERGGIPAGCVACGGPYPLCKDSCPLFDND